MAPSLGSSIGWEGGRDWSDEKRVKQGGDGAPIDKRMPVAAPWTLVP